MRTIGIDLAAQNASTAACRVDWREGRASAEMVRPPAEFEDADGWLVDLIDETARADTWVGVDAPLGWPREMVAAVSSHDRGERWPAPPKERFRFRATDRLLMDDPHRLRPLSVSSDLIAVPAWRCANLLARARRDLDAIRRSGEDRVVEAYPAAAIAAWNLRHGTGYKGGRGNAGRLERRQTRQRLVGEIENRAAWLDVDRHVRRACVESDHALDALLCALVARAAALGSTLAPDEDQLDDARTEGWIHVPTASCLGTLGEARAQAGAGSD